MFLYFMLTSHEPVMYNFSAVLCVWFLYMTQLVLDFFKQNFAEIFSLLFVCEHTFCILLNTLHLHAVTTGSKRLLCSCCDCPSIKRAQNMCCVS